MGINNIHIMVTILTLHSGWIQDIATVCLQPEHRLLIHLGCLIIHFVMVHLCRLLQGHRGPYFS